jgi:predicted SprT family Zn-dependent metalloprotease
MYDHSDLLTDEEIQEAFQHFCYVLNLKREIYWGWNTDLKTTFGRAILREGRVQLASKLWKRATPKERCDVIAHEICHIAVYDQYGQVDLHRREKVQSHGWQWKSLMRKCGYPNAKRCHKVSTKGLVTRHPVFCDCKAHMVTPQMFKKIRSKKKGYLCKLCKGKLREES